MRVRVRVWEGTRRGRRGGKLVELESIGHRGRGKVDTLEFRTGRIELMDRKNKKSFFFAWNETNRLERFSLSNVSALKATDSCKELLDIRSRERE